MTSHGASADSSVYQKSMWVGRSFLRGQFESSASVARIHLQCKKWTIKRCARS